MRDKRRRIELTDFEVPSHSRLQHTRYYTMCHCLKTRLLFDLFITIQCLSFPVQDFQSAKHFLWAGHGRTAAANNHLLFCGLERRHFLGWKFDSAHTIDILESNHYIQCIRATKSQLKKNVFHLELLIYIWVQCWLQILTFSIICLHKFCARFYTCFVSLRKRNILICFECSACTFLRTFDGFSKIVDF